MCLLFGLCVIRCILCTPIIVKEKERQFQPTLEFLYIASCHTKHIIDAIPFFCKCFIFTTIYIFNIILVYIEILFSYNLTPLSLGLRSAFVCRSFQVFFYYYLICDKNMLITSHNNKKSNEKKQSQTLIRQ